MVIVVAKMTAKPGKRAAFAREARGMLAPTRAEPGCISYTLYHSAEGPDNFTFFEEWEGRQALDRHFQTPHFIAFKSALPGLIVGQADLKVYKVAVAS